MHSCNMSDKFNPCLREGEEIDLDARYAFLWFAFSFTPVPSSELRRLYLQHERHLLLCLIMSAVSEFRHLLIQLPSQTDQDADEDEDQTARESSLMSEVSRKV